MLRLVILIFLSLLSINAIAAEEHDLTISMLSRNHYSVQGKGVTLVTQNCQEYSKDEPVTLVIDNLNSTFITFSNGNICKISDILNPNNESF